jgi:hypothetical protein
MSDETPRPRKTLPSASDGPDAPRVTREQIRAVEDAVAPLGITRAVRVPTPGEAKINYSVRTSRDTQDRLKHYAYIERITIGEAIEKLLDIAGAQMPKL